MKRFSLIFLLIVGSGRLFGNEAQEILKKRPPLLEEDHKVSAAAFLAEGRGDVKRAREIYHEGCAQYDGASCLGLAWLQKPGTWRRKYFIRQACNFGDRNGCYQQGLLEKDKKVKQQVFQKSCDKGLPMGCYEAAQMVLESKPKTAIKLLSKSCESAYLVACNHLGILKNEAGETEAARDLFSRVCSRKPKLGCNNLGRLFQSEGKVAQARSLFEKACYKGEDVMGCNSLGALEKTQGNLTKARKLYQLACDKGLSMGCRNLERMPAGN